MVFAGIAYARVNQISRRDGIVYAVPSRQVFTNDLSWVRRLLAL